MNKQRWILIGLMSTAAIAISGCAKKMGNDSAADASSTSSVIYGDAANKQTAPTEKFSAGHYMLVAMRFTADGALHATHVKVRFTGAPNDGGAVDKLANDAFSKLAGDPKAYNWDLRKLKLAGADAGGEDFAIDHFGFGRKHRIYMFISNDGAKFSKKSPVWFGQGFDEFFETKRKAKVSKNYAFYNAKLLNGPNNKADKVLYLENFYSKEGGSPIGDNDPNTYYDMNFNILLSGKNEGTTVPVIVDPDTGNGAGWNPR